MKKGFTLVELLAVIVILAIILAIAVPAISTLLDNSKKNAFESSAKLLLKSIQLKLLENNTFNLNSLKANNVESLLGIDADNYGYLLTRYDENGKVFISLNGAGKWAGLTASGTFEGVIIGDTINSISDSLVVHYDAGDLISYPGTGNTWYDLSGNNNNGTISSGEFYNGYIRNLNNSSNQFYINIPNSTSINSAFTQTTGGWTIEEVIWTNSIVYPEADAGSVVSNSGLGVGPIGFDWNHGTGYGMTALRFEQANGTTYDDGIISIPSQYQTFNKWRVRTLIWNRSENKNYLYINGTLIGTFSTPNTANSVIYDGGGISLGTLYGWRHYGRRASLKIYNRVLSSTEVLQNYNAVKGRYGL